MNLVFDLETNGLLDRRDLKIHCIGAQDVDTGRVYSFRPHELDDGVGLLSEADMLIGHNIGGYDLHVLDRLYPGWKHTTQIFDTMAASRQMYIHNMYERSIKTRNAAGRCSKPKLNPRKKRREECGRCGGCRAREARLPRKMLKWHSLESWGYRLRLYKKDFLKQLGGAAEAFSEELLEYCLADINLNAVLFKFLRENGPERGWPVPPVEAMVVESRVHYLTTLQELNGVGFNVKKATALAAELSEKRAKLLTELRAVVSPWWAPDGPNQGIVYPKWPMKPGIRKSTGVRYGGWGKAPEPHLPPEQTGSEARGKIKLVEFNPASEVHIERTLRKLYGWEPSDFTHSGQAVCDEDTLSSLDYPIIPKLLEYMVVNKRLGQISDGKEAWLKHEKDGRIHCRMHATGARTSRGAHFKPNLGQVPRIGSPYGRECRECFEPTRPGWVLVGADASGIELRFLGHRLAFYDSGAFGHEVVEGDPHELMREATGLYFRDNQKTLTYADLYGAGDTKRGLIVLEDWRQAVREGLTDKKPPTLRQARNLGKRVKTKLTQQIPALKHLQAACHRAHRRKWLRGLDGRIIAVKTQHGSVNDLLQSDAAILMKHAYVTLKELLDAEGFVHGQDYAFVLWVHDEWQIECPLANAGRVGQLAVLAIELAGEKLGVRVPLTGEYKVGQNWAETH